MALLRVRSEPMTTTDARGKVVLAAEGDALRLPGCLMRVKVNGHDTGGAYALLESVALPGEGDAPHIHTEEDEALYVLEGEIEAQMDEQSVLLGAGAYVYLPRYTLHSYKVVGSKPARLLITVSPAGLELYFVESARLLASSATSANALVSLSAEYGIRFVGTLPSPAPVTDTQTALVQQRR